MATKTEITRYQENLRTEQDAIYLYERMAAAEANPDLSEIYGRLADTERKHVEAWEGKLREAGAPAPRYAPTWRSRILGSLAARSGPAMVLPSIAAIEKSAASGYDGQPDAAAMGMPAEERSHARVFGYMAKNTRGLEGSAVARFEGRHRAAGGNALRAGVLGANDGLLSVFSLTMGVAGGGISSHLILLTGLAGMLAGALSMALGEWLSVQSSRELYEHQLGIEKRELATIPEEEKEELALIYQAKGVPPAAAHELADRLLSDNATALDTLAREELSINPQELGGSAWEAAVMSFFLFAFGAMFPVLPYFFLTGTAGIVASAVLSTVALFAIGAAITLMTGRNPVLSGMRQVIFGLAAAAITFGVGRLIGVAVT